MYDKKNNRKYEVYGFDVEHGMALCFDANIPATSKGSGWVKIATKSLIPEAYTNKANASFMSKTERADIKHHLKLVDAIWECEDGVKYTHAALDDAIEHQRQLMLDGKQIGEHLIASP